MAQWRTILVLIAIMMAVTGIASGLAIGILYDTAFEQKRVDLIQTARSQARLMEAVARFDETYSDDYPGGALAATLSQIQDAHAHAGGVGESGEFTLARRRAAARLERARATDKQPASD